MALYSLSEPSFEGSEVWGDVVTQRVIRCASQEDQIRALREMVGEARNLYNIRARARDIVFRQWPTPPKDRRAQALAIASWVQRNITYVEEMPEVFQTPSQTVASGYGDCDDFTSLTAALLEAIGIPSLLVGLEWHVPDEGRAYQHIFAGADLPSGFVPLDATLSWPIDYVMDPIELARQKHPDVKIFVG